MSDNKSLTSIDPKAFFKFFEEADKKDAIVLCQSDKGLHASANQKFVDPPGESVAQMKVRRADVLAFIKAIVAVRQGREVMFFPSNDQFFTLCIGKKK